MKKPISPEAPHHLPDNVPDCHKLIIGLGDLVKSLTARIDELEKQLRRRNRRLFGQQSAKVSANTLTGTGKAVYDDSVSLLEAEQNNLQLVPEQHKPAGGGRNAPKQASTERTIKHTVTDPLELACPCCGDLRKQIGFEISHQLDVLKAVFEKVKHMQFKYACPKCQGEILTAPKPYQPIAKGYAAPGLLAHVAVSKFVWHLPLYRQEKIYLAQSVSIARSTMSRWLKEEADLLELVVKRMQKLMLQSRVIQSDDTSMPVIKKGLGKTHKGYIWIYRGDENFPYVVYDFTEARNQNQPARVLAGYKGVLQTDGTNIYDKVTTNGAEQAGCMSHAFRYFEDARDSAPEEADYALAHMKGLFNIERVAAALTEEERKDLRQRLAKPKLAALKTWLDEQSPTVLPKSALGEAVTYCLNQWDALCYYANTGNVEMHNNQSENGLRPVVLGRRNWMFAGSVEGGRTAATLMSIVHTCRRLDIDPFDYLKDVLARIPSTATSDIDQFLPDKWKAFQDIQKKNAEPS
jgi:transposase